MSETRQPLNDLGTPFPRDAVAQISLQIDGQQIAVEEGTSVLRAAALLGLNVPKLCATDSLDAFGSCRLCLVEIEGRRGYPASCTTEVEAGMVVSTQTDRLHSIRRNVVELYVSDHPLDCVSCAANGDCELQDTAEELNVTTSRYGFSGENHLHEPKDESNPYFTFDPSQCIVCYRCVRACDDIQGTFALTVDGRGFESKITAGQMEDFMDSECVSCGACVNACPTVALTENTVIDKGLPERSVTTTCAYCGVGCSFEAEMKEHDKTVGAAPAAASG